MMKWNSGSVPFFCLKEKVEQIDRSNLTVMRYM